MLEGEAAWAWYFRGLPPPVLRRISEEFFAWQAHGGQQEPAASAGAGSGHWRVWLLMAGRNFGKTRAGAEWVSARARENPGARIALAGATRDEVTKVMIEGPSGLLAVARSDERLRWRPTRGVLEFPNGAEAFPYSGAAPEALRGPEHHFAWCDELAKWRRAEAAWDNLMLGLRLGERPRAIVTTTPRSGAILRRVRADSGTVETNGTMAENVHASGAFVRWAEAAYGGTRLGRQELEGVLFDQPEGALFPREIMEKGRVQLGTVTSNCPFGRVVVGVDPPASVEGACGIVVCALGADEIAYVLDDRSVAGLRPEGWARAVAAAARDWGADRVIAEQNQGGDMVESVLRSIEARLPVRLVSASRGKVARAEPVAALFESGRARLAGRFPALEDELAGLTLAGGYEGPGKSPDRADALVWAMAELAAPRAEPRIRML
ncbi:MAG: ATP-binding protein [Alphaproteobacteria bacterium]|nr:MAG: ATP-binding protein [Alphaproteobacteria bacterium]